MREMEFLPAPIPTQAFYVLLSLCDRSLHAYAIKGSLFGVSLGSVQLAQGRISRLLTWMTDQGLIEIAGELPAGKSGKLRMHYRITSEGRLVLLAECRRLKYAVTVAETQGLLEDETPLDIKRQQLEFRLAEASEA